MPASSETFEMLALRKNLVFYWFGTMPQTNRVLNLLATIVHYSIQDWALTKNQ